MFYNPVVNELRCSHYGISSVEVIQNSRDGDLKDSVLGHRKRRETLENIVWLERPAVEVTEVDQGE